MTEFRDVRAAVLEEEMAEQRSSVPAAPTKTAATQRTSQRAERAIKCSAIARAAPKKNGFRTGPRGGYTSRARETAAAVPDR